MTALLSTGRTRALAAALAAALVAALLGPVGLAPADAGVPHGDVVGEQPRLDTPNVENGIVHAVRQIGDRVIVGGSFTQVRKTDGTLVNQAYLAAYDATTGAFDDSFTPTFDKEVRAIHASHDQNAIFVGGKFNNVNGIHRTKLAKLDLAGNTVTAFKANATAVVTGITVDSSRVYATGSFRKINGVTRDYLGAVDATTGAVDTTFDLPLSGALGPGAAIAGKEVDITSDHSTLLVASTARYIDGLDRFGVAVVDLTGPTATVAPWRTRLYQDWIYRCTSGSLQMRDAEIAPDDSYLVTVTKGHDRPPACDTAIRFPLDDLNDTDVDPDWVSRHFDSVYSVGISDVAVYTGGHFRYQESPTSPDPWPGDTFTTYLNPAVLGSDVVPRDQIGALDPATGKSLDWDTSTNSFEGVFALETAPIGLLVGHDRQLIGSYDVGRHGVYPLSVEDLADPTVTVDAPAQNAVVGANVTLTGTASDDVAVAAVYVALFDRDTNLWLRADGTWGAWQKLPASLAAPGAPTSGYVLARTLHDARYKANVWAVDSSGKDTTPRVKRQFEVSTVIDLEDPTVTVDNPQPDQVVGPTVTIDGTASDDVAVDEVWVAIFDRDLGVWLRADGTWGAWQKLATSLTAPGGDQTDFTFTDVLPAGRFKLKTWAVDGTGKDTDPRVSVKFEVA
ncbi:MAG: Ig-like domain-containing protein [Acidimicrobiia bacterium]|nr:Ig-like domain-containing protein [Acidimicrobiia bacterium]